MANSEKIRIRMEAYDHRRLDKLKSSETRRTNAYVAAVLADTDQTLYGVHHIDEVRGFEMHCCT